ncbi:MAG: dTMP kinase [Nitrososphaerales archaeon]
MLVVIEGSDKAGKATQSQMLSERLEKEGFSAAVMSFPNYSTKIGEEIKAFLHGEKEYPVQVRHMLLAANRWEKKTEIERMLKEKDVVILNRYYQSNLVYGAASGLKLEWLESLDAGLPKEELVMVLDVTPEVSLTRMQSKGDLFEMDNDMMSSVSKLYRDLASRYGWVLVNGDRSREEVHGEIFQIVKERIAKKQ